MAGYSGKRRSGGLLAWMMASLMVGGGANAGPPAEVPGQAVNGPDLPELSFPDRAYGEVAINQLGANLPEVAAWYGMTPGEFIAILRKDSSAWIDMQGRLLFIDQFPEPSAQSESNPIIQGAPIPLAETFKLHSRPGADRVIYLDFDGHVTTNSVWNSGAAPDTIASPPYTRDSDSSTFSDSELQNIQSMWRQVAEDYAPFNVDVTTEDPGEEAIIRANSSDPYYGTRVVITEDNFDNCGCGGFAYVGVFDWYSSTNPGYYQPAFVFNTGVVGAGEAISHEAGHNLGLWHHGTTTQGYYPGHNAGSGTLGWAPIMGVGYYEELVQWSKGEYPDAYNPDDPDQDDILVIQQNGAPLMTDDHGDSNNLAVDLDVTTDGTTATLSGSGLIHLRSDVDVFRFIAGAGAYSLTIDAAPYNNPNLDVLATLYDSSGAVVASDNLPNELSASISGTGLPAGEYFLHVEGTERLPLDTGWSDYGSLGRYVVSGTVPDPLGLAPPIASASTEYTPALAQAWVYFDGTNSTPGDGDNHISSWDWDFGDDNLGSGEAVGHEYELPGTYTATLTVTQSPSGLTDSDSLTIEVLNNPPLADASGSSNLSGTVPHTVNFVGAGSDIDGTIDSWHWDFGDGNSSIQQSPAHSYATAGSLTATLTVTDNLGATAQDFVLVEIAPPSYYDQLAQSETAVAGTVTGSYTLTHSDNDDGDSQAIRERESGGRPTNRHSYLEHRWQFDVVSGDAVTLFIKASRDGDGEPETLDFRYRVNGGGEQLLAFVTNDNSQQTFALPANTSGPVELVLRDGNQGSGYRALDTFRVDYLNIRTDNSGGGTGPTAPVPASGLSASAVSISQIDLGWSDNSGNGKGFRIDRSPDGAAWELLSDVPADTSAHSDTSLDPETTYYYRVIAYNDEGDAAPSNTADATTHSDNPGNVVLSVSPHKIKGVKYVDLFWDGLDSGATVYQDGQLIVSGVEGPYSHNLNSKGGGSYSYQVCPDGALVGSAGCSNIATAVF